MRKNVFALVAVVLWASAVVMFAASVVVDGLGVLKWAALADALAAAVVTTLAIRRGL